MGYAIAPKIFNLMCQFFLRACCMHGGCNRSVRTAHSNQRYSLYIYQTKTFVGNVIVEDGTKVPLFVEPCNDRRSGATSSVEPCDNRCWGANSCKL